MGKYVRGISMNIENIGKLIKSTKKKYSWEVKVDSKEYLVQYTRSSMSGKDKIMVNGEIVYQHQERMRKPLHVTFMGDDNTFMIVEYNEVYKLFINSKDFDDYYGHDNVKSILKKSKIDDEIDKKAPTANPKAPVNINANHMQNYDTIGPNSQGKQARKSNKKVSFNLAQDNHEDTDSPPQNPIMAPGVIAHHHGTAQDSPLKVYFGQNQHNSIQNHNSPVETYAAYESNFMNDSLTPDRNINSGFEAINSNSKQYQTTLYGQQTALPHQSVPQNGPQTNILQQSLTGNLHPVHHGAHTVHTAHYTAHAPSNGQQGYHHQTSNHQQANVYTPPPAQQGSTRYGDFHSIADSTSYSQPQPANPVMTQGNNLIPDFPIHTSGTHALQMSQEPSNFQHEIQPVQDEKPYKQSLSDYLSKTVSDSQQNQKGAPQTQSGFGIGVGINAQVHQNSPDAYHHTSQGQPQIAQPIIFQQSTHPPSRTMRAPDNTGGQSHPGSHPGSQPGSQPGSHPTSYQNSPAMDSYGLAQQKVASGLKLSKGSPTKSPPGMATNQFQQGVRR